MGSGHYGPLVVGLQASYHSLLFPRFVLFVGVEVLVGIVVVAAAMVVAVGVLVVVGIAMQGIHTLRIVFLALCRWCCSVCGGQAMALPLRHGRRCYTLKDRCTQVYGLSK